MPLEQGIYPCRLTVSLTSGGNYKYYLIEAKQLGWLSVKRYNISNH